MTSATLVTRRDFARIALAGASGTMLGCGEGVFSPEKELVLTLTGAGRIFDASGKPLATQGLAPGIATARLDGLLIRPGPVTNSLGALRVPPPGVLAYARASGIGPRVFRRTDRSRDGTVIETESNKLGDGIPSRRTVRIPGHGVELVDAYDFEENGSLAVFRQRTIQLRTGGRLLADLTIQGSGELRIAAAPSLRALAAGNPFLPRALLADEGCPASVVLHYISATLAVLAALATCTAGPVCLFALASALIDWALAIDEMEKCRET
jgi:hypothetical protein